MTIRNNSPFLFATLLFSSTLFFSCKEKAEQVTDANEKICISDSMEKIIHIDSAVMGIVGDELKLSGEISFSDNRVIKVYPFSSGKVMQVKVSLGDKVIKGQPLAIIKSADVAGNYSDISSSGNDVAIAKRQMENTESLFKNGIASEREFSEAKQNYQKTIKNEAKLQAQISINGGGHTAADGNYIVTAPASGYIVEKKINEGAFIRSDNAENMFTIGDISEVWVNANVYESDIARVKEGYAANVTTLAYQNKVFSGVIDKVNQLLEPDTKVMKVRVKLQNNGLLLKPEMFANIIIQNKEGVPAIMIPKTGIISKDGKNYVVLYEGKCNLKVKEVEILKTVEDKTYIKSGLSAGEKIITANQLLLFRALTEK
jgi:membrane fusion protein, heavy metal efflux system